MSLLKTLIRIAVVSSRKGLGGDASGLPQSQSKLPTSPVLEYSRDVALAVSMQLLATPMQIIKKPQKLLLMQKSVRLKSKYVSQRWPGNGPKVIGGSPVQKCVECAAAARRLVPNSTSLHQG